MISWPWLGPQSDPVPGPDSNPQPNPETQRPLGYWVLGGFTLGSTVCAYLFARLLFEQYKKKVFLSAFTVPTRALRRRNSTASDFTDIVEKDMIPTASAS